jgi:hypothetical protein
VALIGSALAVWNLIVSVHLVKLGKEGRNSKAARRRELLVSESVVWPGSHVLRPSGGIKLVLRIQNQTFILIMTGASITGFGSVMALAGIWSNAKDVLCIGV